MATEDYEKSIIERVCAGDMLAFEDIVDRYKKKVYYIAYDIVGNHHDAEDISQEVFIKMYRSLGRFRKDAKMGSWIYQIAVNTSIDVLRKRKTRPQINVINLEQTEARENFPAPSGGTDNPERRAEAALMQEHIQKALIKITPQERAVFVMRHYNEFKISEIAEVLKVSSGTVKSLLFRALKKMQKEFGTDRGKRPWEVNYE